MDALKDYVVRLDFGKRLVEIGDLPLDPEPGESWALDWSLL